MEPPKVFVSYATEDNERFVIAFATKLRSEQGLDAFVDTWEIRPGDSLVGKIFDEGIGKAQAVIVVISEHSINKPWVREELDVSTVRKIEDGIRLIPVVIGNIERHQIPTSLRATVWQRISNLNEYDDELSRIVDAIYDRRERPPLGQQPEYTRADLGVVPELSPSDSVVLRLCCEMEMQRGEREATIDADAVIAEAERADLNRELAVDAMDILNGRGYLSASYRLGNSAPSRLTVTDLGFDKYARTFLPGYDTLIRSVGLEIVNHGEQRSRAIAQSLDSSQVVVEHILALFESRGWVVVHQETLPWMDIGRVSTELRRWLEET